MAKNKLSLILFAVFTILASLTCGKSPSNDYKVKRWLSNKALLGYNYDIDRQRGNLYGSGSSLMPEYLGRKKSKIAPGDYLDWPRFTSPKVMPSKPDSISTMKLQHYINEMLFPEFGSDRIIEYIKNYQNVMGDTSRNEFFGRFTINDQHFSLGGWYDKFVVLGVYILFKNRDEFLINAAKYFKLPQLCPDSLTDSSKDSIIFFEYVDHKNGFRLRGFPVSIIPRNSFGEGYDGTVIEYTKYFDRKYMHDFVALEPKTNAKIDTINKFREWPTELTFESYPFVDTMRGVFFISGYYPTRYNRVRRNDRKIPGDYLFAPTWKGLYYQESRPDSINLRILKGYLNNMLKEKYYSDTLAEFISNFKGVLQDTSRYEFYGQFIDHNNKISFGGWYGKFAVIGLYIPFYNKESFSTLAKEYYNLPKIDLTKVEATKREDRAFYEYYDAKLSIRLRGFDVLLIDNDNYDNAWHTTVIEFTKYYDPDFAP